MSAAGVGLLTKAYSKRRRGGKWDFVRRLQGIVLLAAATGAALRAVRGRSRGSPSCVFTMAKQHSSRRLYPASRTAQGANDTFRWYGYTSGRERARLFIYASFNHSAASQQRGIPAEDRRDNVVHVARGSVAG